MTGAGERFAIATAEADAVAAGEADLAMRDADVFAIADADTAAVEGSDLRDDALFDEAVLRPLEGDGAAVRAGEREATDRDVLRACLHFEEGVERGKAHLAFRDRFRRPGIQHAAVLVVKPLTRRVQFLQRVLEVVAVVRMQVVTAILLQCEQPRGGIERGDGFEKVPPAVLREDVEFHVLGMRPGANVLGFHEKRAFP